MLKVAQKELLLDETAWTPTTLGELASDINERVTNPYECEFNRFVGLEHFVSGELMIKNWGATKNLVSAVKVFHKGDILFARRNAYLKRASLVEFDGVCSSDAFVLRENHDHIVPGFLAFILNSENLWIYAISNAAGTMSKRVKWRDLANYEFLLPNKEQQEKIADLIWAGDKSLDKKNSVKKNLQILIQATFKERCGLAQGCKEYQIKDLLIDGPRNGFSPKGNSDGEGAKTVSIGAVKDGKFTPEGNIKYAVVENEILKKFDVLADDVFVVRGNGNKQLCGRAGLSNESYSNLFYPDLLIRLRFDTDLVLPEFAVFQWNTLKAHMKLLRSAKSTNGIWKVNGDDIKRHKIAIPPIAEQRKIMDEISNIDSRLGLCKVSVSGTKQLLNSLINGIF